MSLMLRASEEAGLWHYTVILERRRSVVGAPS